MSVLDGREAAFDALDSVLRGAVAPTAETWGTSQQEQAAMRRAELLAGGPAPRRPPKAD